MICPTDGFVTQTGPREFGPRGRSAGKAVAVCPVHLVPSGPTAAHSPPRASVSASLTGVGQLSCLGAWASAGQWGRRVAPARPHSPPQATPERLQVQVFICRGFLPHALGTGLQLQRVAAVPAACTRRVTFFSVAGGLPSAPGAAPAFGTNGDFWGQERRWAGMVCAGAGAGC